MAAYLFVALVVNGIAWALNGWAWFTFSRATERRFDAQAERLAKVEGRVGLRPGFPYDKLCPMCGARPGMDCEDVEGRIKDEAHHARYL